MGQGTGVLYGNHILLTRKDSLSTKPYGTLLPLAVLTLAISWDYGASTYGSPDAFQTARPRTSAERKTRRRPDYEKILAFGKPPGRFHDDRHRGNMGPGAICRSSLSFPCERGRSASGP